MIYSQKADFAPHLNTIFEVHPRGREDRVPIELVEITEKNGKRTESFSLMFRGPNKAVFGHDTHTIVHHVLGKFDLFIGPVMNPKINGVCYQAIFSRIKDPCKPII